MPVRVRDMSRVSRRQVLDQLPTANDIPENLIATRVIRHSSTPDNWGSVPVAVTLDPPGVVQMFHPWEASKEGTLDARSLTVMGSIRAGKSALVAVLITALANLKNKYGESARVLGTSRKRGGADPEYLKMIQYLEGAHIDMALNSFNTFEKALGISESGQFQLLLTRLSFTGKELTVEEEEAAQVGLHTLYRAAEEKGRDGNLKWLRTKLLSMTNNDIDAYMVSDEFIDDVPPDELGETASSPQIALSEEQYATTKAAAARVASMIASYIKRYKGAFSGTDSLAEAMENDAVLFDFTNVELQQEPLMNLLLMQIRALIGNNPRFKVHAMWSDESYNDWRDPELAAFLSVIYKMIRQNVTFHIQVMHALRDVESAGSADDVNVLQGMGALKDQGLYAFGRFKRRDDAIDAQGLVGFTDMVLNHIMEQTLGQFTFVSDDELRAPVMLETNLTAAELDFTHTEGATNEMIIPKEVPA